MGYIKIIPIDTLFFRSGKPFTAGMDSWTESTFLPNPSVIWGALFSVLFSEGKVNRNRLADNEIKKLKIENIYLYNEKKQIVLIPAPLDIFVDENGNYHLPKYKDVTFSSNYPLRVLSMVEGKDVKQIENMFIEINSLYKHYVNQYRRNLQLYDFNEIFVSDYKVGIRRNRKTLSSEEKQLYRIDLTQFREEWSFLIEYELKEIKFPEKGILKLGGEGKTARYECINKTPATLESAQKLKKELKIENYIKILLKTPAYFENGWGPKTDNLLCASVGKPLYIGGFDMAKRKPKPMKRYVPAGSVFVFKKNDQEFDFKTDDSEPFKGFGKYEKLPI